jgi:hypothetical protein
MGGLCVMVEQKRMVGFNKGGGDQKSLGTSAHSVAESKIGD